MNLSKQGLFVRMPQPLEPGTRVAISLEAHGRALPFAQGEVRWCRVQPSELEGRFQGCGVRFTGFLHPRSPELVDYLVKTLETGAPLTLAPRRRRRERVLALVAASALVFLAVAAALVFGLPTAGPEEGPLPGPGALEALSVAPKTADELAALIAPAEDPAPEDLAVAADEGALAAAAVDPDPLAGRVAAERDSTAVQVEREALARAPETAPPTLGAAPMAGASAETSPVGEREQATPDRAERVANAPAGSVAASLVPSPNEGPDALTGAPAARVTAQERVPPGAVAAPPGHADEPSSVRRHPRASPSPGSAGHVTLPSGAASGLSWTPGPDGLDVRPELRPEARVARVFALSDPPRLVFDIEGSAPAKSHATLLESGLLSRVRLGRQGARTRVVLDLGVEPQRVVSHGDRATVRF